MHSASQQMSEMPALPPFGLTIMGKLQFVLLKLGMVDIPAAINVLARQQLVQHFVEHDTFDKVSWHKRLVQKAMNTNQALLLVVRTEPYRIAPPAWWKTGPSNTSLDAIGKIGLIQLATDGLEVKITSLRLEKRAS